MNTRNLITRIRHDQAGVSTTEFGIIASLFALASVQVLGSIGGEVEQNFDDTAQTVATDRETRANPFARGNGTPGDSVNVTAKSNEPTTAGVSPFEPPLAGDQPIIEQTYTTYEPTTASMKQRP